MTFNPVTIVIIVIALIVLAIFLHFVPMGLWISSLASGVHVSIGSLVGMRIRRIQPQRLVYPLIKSTKAGLNLTISQLETHFLAGGKKKPAPSIWPAATYSRPYR